MTLSERSRRAWEDLRLKLRHLPLVEALAGEPSAAQELASPVPQDWSLADAERLEAYQRAIERYVKPGQVVLDVGTGTGLRALLAAGRQPRKVYAVDATRNLDTARWVARRHGLQGIEFLRVNGTRFQPPEPVDVLLHEQMGESLFDVGLVPRMLEWRQRVLRAGGRILPNRFEVFLEPVQLREEARLPFIWSQRLPAVDYSCLQALRDAMSPSYFTRLIRPHEVHHLLCDPEPAFAFDLETLEPGLLPRRVQTLRPVVREGRLDGFCLFYRASFDGELSFDTFPARRPGHGALLLRVDSRDYARYQPLCLDVSMPDVADVTTWRWRFE